jgi:hypothetical protein
MVLEGCDVDFFSVIGPQNLVLGISSVQRKPHLASSAKMQHPCTCDHWLIMVVESAL